VVRTGLVDELVQLTEGQGPGNRVAGRDPLDVGVVVREGRVVHRVRLLVHADEVAVTAGVAEHLAPVVDRREADALDAVREELQVDLVVRLDVLQVLLDALERLLHVELHPERHRAGPQRPPRVHDDEGRDQQAVRGYAPPPVPPAMQLRHEGAQVVGLLVADAPHAIAAPLGQPGDVVQQSRLEAPLRLGGTLGRLGRVPRAVLGVVALEVLLDPLAVADELLLVRAAQRAVLEDVPLGDARHGPRARALGDEDGPARLEDVVEKALVGAAEPEPLVAEVRQGPDHEPVLVRVVHVVEGDVGVRLDQVPARLEAGLHRGLRLVGVDRLAHRDEERLRQPRHAQGRAEVDQRPARRSDRDSRVAPARVEGRDPLRDLLDVDRGQPSRRDGLAPATDDVEPLACDLGQEVRAGGEWLQDRGLAEGGKVLALHAAGGRLDHGGSGVEVRDERRTGHGQDLPLRRRSARTAAPAATATPAPMAVRRTVRTASPPQPPSTSWSS
jgi:hypothetical protein